MGFFVGKRFRAGGITVGYYWRPHLRRVHEAGRRVVASSSLSPGAQAVVFVVLLIVFLAVGHC